MYESGEKRSNRPDPTMSIETQTQSNSIETETIDNPERGCGYLKEGKAYLRSDVGAGGELPAFVEFAQPIPFKENRKRSYKEFPGLQFELAVTGPGGLTETVPEGEASRHVERLLADRPTGTHAGEMVEFESHDLLLSVGKSHYPTAEEFVNEARVHGVSKAISVTSGNAPPEINPGRTRLFLIHPNAVETTKEVETTFSEYDPETDTLLTVGGEPVKDEAKTAELCDGDVEVTLERRLRTAGIFGYTYLTRVVYTEDADGEIPKYVQDYEATGDLDVVKPDTPTPYSEQEAFNEDGELIEEYHDHLDSDAIVGELEGAEDEIRDFAETYTPDGEGGFEAGPLAVEEMERADFGDLAGRGWVEAESPLMADDALEGADDGALAVVDGEAVFPSNNLNVEQKGGYTKGVSVVGPYRVESRLLNTGGRRVKVEKTR
ncbi:hypothetical protein [Halorubrum sp. F4]|uniref:hypothetical protein n=1 Tax=Halorubrum sp. F4 TaxID=2989715 RepID=UPI0024816175|nr:hypothetical protein [Halorubrum sp. F4]